jgi:ketosteroid isomerase-like protein
MNDPRLDLYELIHRYSVCLDTGDFDGLEVVFADDVVFDVTPDPGLFPLPVKGKDELMAALRARYEEVQETAVRRHLVTCTMVDELEDDRARTRSLLTVVSVPHGAAPELRGTGVYHDEFVRRDSRWLFKQRHLKVDALSTG